MNVTTTMYTDANSIILEGWKALVSQLGIQKATQFILLVERGKGDSVQEIADYWQDASIETIFEKVNAWKAKPAQ